MPDLASVLEQARVPEHSAPFMQAMSQGTAFLEGEYLFLTGTRSTSCRATRPCPPACAARWKLPLKS